MTKMIIIEKIPIKIVYSFFCYLWYISENTTVADLFDINFAMTKYPDFNEKFFESSHTGVTYYLGNRVEPPFDPPFIPAFRNDTQKMFYAYLSDYVLNAGFYAAYLGDMLSYYVTDELLVHVSILSFNLIISALFVCLQEVK